MFITVDTVLAAFLSCCIIFQASAVAKFSEHKWRGAGRPMVPIQ